MRIVRLPDPLPHHLVSLRQHELTLGGVRIGYAEGGEGPPVLILHGAIFAGNVFWWETAAATVAQGMRAIVPDFPGWGDSARPAGAYTMTFYHDFITAFLDALGLDRVAIVGHSMGALLGSSYALLHPERVASLVLVAAPAAWVEFELPMLFRPFTFPVVGEIAIGALPILGPSHPLGIRRFYEGLMHAPEAIAGPRMAAMLAGCVDATRDPLHRLAFLRTLRANLGLIRSGVRGEFEAKLRARPLPVMIIAGREDRLFPLPLVEAGARALPEIHLEVLDACGHFPMWERAEVVEGLIAGFLAGHADRVA